jgi:drug/metabolite transporter superfamily protein YnfA
MRDEHIRKLLDEAPLASLGAAELARVRAHAESCADCRRAFEAARAASTLMKARASQPVEPSPFFQTRVMAALREHRAAEEGWTLKRLWKSAGLLVSSMAATVAALAVFTFVAPDQTAGQDLASAGGAYSAETLILDEGSDDDEMTYEQVLTSLYGSDDDVVR